MSSVQRYPYLTVINAPKLAWKVGNPEKRAMTPTTTTEDEIEPLPHAVYKSSEQTFRLTDNLTLFANVGSARIGRCGDELGHSHTESASFSFSTRMQEQTLLGRICWGHEYTSARYYIGEGLCPPLPFVSDPAEQKDNVTQFAIIKGDFMSNETGVIGKDGREDFAITALDGSILVLLGENDNAWENP